jgi:hypothetical protein
MVTSGFRRFAAAGFGAIAYLRVHWTLLIHSPYPQGPERSRRTEYISGTNT